MNGLDYMTYQLEIDIDIKAKYFIKSLQSIIEKEYLIKKKNFKFINIKSINKENKDKYIYLFDYMNENLENYIENEMIDMTKNIKNIYPEFSNYWKIIYKIIK